MFNILEADIVVMQEAKIQRKDLQDDMVLVPGWDCYFSLPKHKKGNLCRFKDAYQFLTESRVFWRRDLHEAIRLRSDQSRGGYYWHTVPSKLLHQLQQTS